MHIIIPDDCQDAVRGLDCFAKLAGHEVTIFNDTVKEVDAWRSGSGRPTLSSSSRAHAISEALLARLPRLRLISQTGRGTAHIDLDACVRQGVVVTRGSDRLTHRRS